MDRYTGTYGYKLTHRHKDICAVAQTAGAQKQDVFEGKGGDYQRQRGSMTKVGLTLGTRTRTPRTSGSAVGTICYDIRVLVLLRVSRWIYSETAKALEGTGEGGGGGGRTKGRAKMP